MMIVGGIRISTSSPWRVSRAIRCCSAIRESLAIIAAGSGPEPRMSMSRPLSVAVIWMSSGFPMGISGSAKAHAASKRATQARIEDRTPIDGNDVVRIRGGESHL